MPKPESEVLFEGKYTIAISLRPKQSGEGSRFNEGDKSTSPSSNGELYNMTMKLHSRLRRSKRKA